MSNERDINTDMDSEILVLIWNLEQFYDGSFACKTKSTRYFFGDSDRNLNRCLVAFPGRLWGTSNFRH
jgi:hypothetical protein